MATIAQAQAQVERIWRATFHEELASTLQEHLRQQALRGVHAALEAALVEELLAYRATTPTAARRSGYAERRVLTTFGFIPDLAVPKLRAGNAARPWQILTRYQLSMSRVLDQSLYLYTLGLSIRDLQEALYVLLDHTLSREAINRITIAAQSPMEQWRRRPLTDTPPVLLVDGVWMHILGPTGKTWTDRAGHVRQEMRGRDQVMLAVMGVWPDGRHQILSYALADSEAAAGWSALFADLIARGLDAAQVQIVGSDGATGLPAAIATHFPHAQQQRCVEHKVRGLDKHLSYTELALTDATTQEALSYKEACRQRRHVVFMDAHAIFEAPTRGEAEARLATFCTQWQAREPKMVRALRRDIALCFSFYAFDPTLHPLIRSTNLIERFFREFRTKADEIGSFPNDMTALVLFHIIVTRDDAKHDRGKVAKTG